MKFGSIGHEVEKKKQKNKKTVAMNSAMEFFLGDYVKIVI